MRPNYPRQKMQTMYKKMCRILTPGQRRRMARVLLAVTARAFLDFAGIAALFPVLLLALRPQDGRGTMLLLCAGVLLFVCLKNALVVWLARIQSRFQLDVYQDIGQRVFANHYRRGLLYLKRKGSTALSYEVNYACYAFSQNVLASLFRLCGEGLLASLMILALLGWEPLAGCLLCLAFAPSVYLYVRFVRKRLRRYGQEELEARRRQARTVVDAFRGYAEVEIARAFPHSLSVYAEGSAAISRSRLHTETAQLLPLFLSETAVVVSIALLAATGRGDLGLSGGVFAIAAFRLIPAIRGILNAYSTLQNTSHTVDLVSEGLSASCTADTHPDIPTFVFEHRIELRGVAYGFPGEPPLFRGLDWHIGRGERVGIRGASGSGKSTLFNLLLGFIPCTEGGIYIDGKQLTPANRTGWHRLVGYVPQEIYIGEGTLLENIALGYPQPNREKALRVLEQVQLADWLETLEAGLDTPLGEFGNRLSGGQKQRIGIARALYKEAEVLFFDEATSALDHQTEQEVNHALRRLSETHRDLTLIIIAHRESSLTVCDRILDLEQYRCTAHKQPPRNTH